MRLYCVITGDHFIGLFTEFALYFDAQLAYNMFYLPVFKYS